MTPRRPPPSRLTRRRAIGLGGAAVVAPPLLSMPLLSVPLLDRAAAATATGSTEEAVAEILRPEIKPRSAWAGDLPVTGDILVEEDVRFLLVHHTASTNDYTEDEVVGEIQQFYRFHTGPEKGWPDVAYNFFVDRFGGIWEARDGSLAGAVRGDATGGSQGHAMLCSLIGDHSEEAITPEASAALVTLLAWLGVRHRVDTTPGTTVDFQSRGSNRWPAGATVTARTISGHRDMSRTSCPGDFAYDRLAEEIPAAVTATIAAARATAPSTSSPSAFPSSTGVTVVPQTSPPTSAAPSPTDAAPEEVAVAPGASETAGGSDTGRLAVVLGGVATTTAVALAGLARLRRRAFNQDLNR